MVFVDARRTRKKQVKTRTLKTEGAATVRHLLRHPVVLTG
jgi:hypothetical protein